MSPRVWLDFGFACEMHLEIEQTIYYTKCGGDCGFYAYSDSRERPRWRDNLTNTIASPNANCGAEIDDNYLECIWNRWTTNFGKLV